MIKLSIVIPTYDRNAVLLANLPRVLDQLTDECELIILDNASPTPVEETLRSVGVLSGKPSRVSIHRNRYNLGGNANILRCFEMGTGDWVWTLGDDDLVNTGAVNRILDYIDRYNGGVLINFQSHVSHVPRSDDKVSTGRMDFLVKVEQLTAISFISVCVYHRARTCRALEFGYQYTYSSFPQVVLVIMALSEDSMCVFSKDRLLDQICIGQDTGTYAEVPIGMAVTGLRNLPLPLAEKRILDNMIGDLARIWLRPARLFRELLFDGRRSPAQRRVCLRTLRRGLYSLRPSLWRRLELGVYGVMLWFPGCSLSLYRFLYRIARDGRSPPERRVNRL